MKYFVIIVFALFGFYVSAEEQITVTVFKMKDGRSIESVRFAAVGDEGSKTFMLKTTEGERITVAEEDVVSRTERHIPVSELSEKARAQIQHPADAGIHAVAHEDENAKKSQEQSAVRTDIDARTALRKADDALAQSKARLIPIQQFITDTTTAIAAAQATSDAAARELAAIPDAKGRNNQDPVARDAENKREARRESLRRKIKTADDEKARLTLKKTDAEKQASEIADQINKLTEKKQAAQKDADSAAAEKSKAIIAANSLDSPKKAGDAAPDSTTHIVKLKDGSTLRARSIKKVDGGYLVIVDEKGQEHRVLETAVESKE